MKKLRDIRKDKQPDTTGVHFSIPKGVRYGVVCSTVMENPELSIEAKCIYSYLCLMAKPLGYAYPSVENVCRTLGISKNRYYSHMNQLKEHGVVKVTKQRSTITGNSYNLYQIIDPIYQLNEQQIVDDFKKPENGSFNYTGIPDCEIEEMFRDLGFE